MAQLAAFFESAFFASYPSGCTGNLGVCSSFLPLPKARARIARRRSVCLVEETIGNYLQKCSAHGSAERAGTMTNGAWVVNRNASWRGQLPAKTRPTQTQVSPGASNWTPFAHLLRGA